MDNAQLSKVYPKWKFTATESRLVKNVTEERALGSDWYDHPSKVGLPSAADLDAVAKEAEAKTATQSAPHVPVAQPAQVPTAPVAKPVQDAPAVQQTKPVQPASVAKKPDWSKK